MFFDRLSIHGKHKKGKENKLVCRSEVLLVLDNDIYFLKHSMNMILKMPHSKAFGMMYLQNEVESGKKFVLKPQMTKTS